jgi:hypothetical protein
MSGFVDPVSLSKLVARVDEDELEGIEEYFASISAGLPYEHWPSGELRVVGPVARGVAGRIAAVIRGYRERGEPVFEPLCELAELLDTAQTETTLDRTEDEWRQG